MCYVTNVSTCIITSQPNETEVLKENMMFLNFFSMQRKILQIIKDDFSEDIHLTYRMLITMKVASRHPHV